MGTGGRMPVSGRRMVSWACVLGVALFCLGLRSAPAFAAEGPPYEFSAELSLTGGCGTSSADEVPDPGCPGKKPPKPFTSPRAIGIDSFGDEYVASYGAEEGRQGRIDVFGPEGVFITEVKDEFGPRNAPRASESTQTPVFIQTGDCAAQEHSNSS